MGNVALDCARVLLQPLQRLEKTDAADHALSELRGSAVEAVHVIGRRGPAQVPQVLVSHVISHIAWELLNACLMRSLAVAAAWLHPFYTYSNADGHRVRPCCRAATTPARTVKTEKPIWKGQLQAAFTAKELREVLGLEGIHVCIPAAEMEMTPADEAELKSSRGRKRVYDLLLKAADRCPHPQNVEVPSQYCP